MNVILHTELTGQEWGKLYDSLAGYTQYLLGRGVVAAYEGDAEGHEYWKNEADQIMVLHDKIKLSLVEVKQ